jgi:hypothetical protein
MHQPAYNNVEVNTMKRKLGTIYKATCSGNGKVYIGMTFQKPEYRWQQHLSAAINKPSITSCFPNCIRKYGAASITFATLYQGKHTRHELGELEVYFIELYDSYYNGLNSTLGGDCRSYTTEITAKIIATRRANGSYVTAAAKMVATKRANGTNKIAAAKALGTKRANGTDKLASEKRIATMRANGTLLVAVAKAIETKRANGTDKTAAAKATETKMANGTYKIAGAKMVATRKLRGTSAAGPTHHLAKTYTITSPSGEVFTVCGGLQSFCADLNISYGALRARIGKGPVKTNPNVTSTVAKNTIGWSIIEVPKGD